MEREYITAISIENGIILLIEPNGQLGMYHQRGIKTLTKPEINSEIRAGRLNPNWDNFPELPRNYSISFEDPEIMGRAIATYSLILKKNATKRNKKG